MMGVWSRTSPPPTRPPPAHPPAGPPLVEGQPVGRRVRVAGNELELFVESPPVFRAMVEDIRAATSRVWLESYIFLNDAAGLAIGEALKERARAGVDVRVLYDAVGSYTTTGSFWNDLTAAGVKVHAFHSFWEAFWKFAPLRVLNRRDHRKLLVV